MHYLYFKILHLIANPIASARNKQMEIKSENVNILEELRRLRTENRRLHELVIQKTELGAESLNESANTNNNTSYVDGSMDSSMHTSVLNTSVANVNVNATSIGIDAAKRITRMKELFRERINSYREAVYLLTGYKVRFCVYIIAIKY